VHRRRTVSTSCLPLQTSEASPVCA
jgi:hypothetical protein